jgi:hypothetical protein
LARQCRNVSRQRAGARSAAALCRPYGPQRRTRLPAPQHIEIARDAAYIERMLDTEAAFWDEVLAG